MIALLRYWRAGLVAVLTAAAVAPPAYWLGHWQGSRAAESRLRAEANEARLIVIEEERNRRDEIDSLGDAELLDRLRRQWLRE